MYETILNISLSAIIIIMLILTFKIFVIEEKIRKKAFQEKWEKEQQENNDVRKKCKTTKKQNYEEWRAEQKTEGEENI